MRKTSGRVAKRGTGYQADGFALPSTLNASAIRGCFMIQRVCALPLVAMSAVRLLSAQATTETWTIDPNHTTAQFAVRHLMVSTVRGQFEKVSGTMQMAGTDVRTLSVNVTI